MENNNGGKVCPADDTAMEMAAAAEKRWPDDLPRTAPGYGMSLYYFMSNQWVRAW